MEEPRYYGSYLQIEKILDAQHPVSFREGNEPAHDEMLFIIIHQAYELWFKQILFELDYVTGVFSKEQINDNSEDLNLVRHRLNRVIQILQLLNQQVQILDTMTPLDFLEFRNLLTPSSGFQSKQFRLLEAKLGLQIDARHQKDYYKRTNEGGFTQQDYHTITQTEAKPNLLQLVNRWLERMPFFRDEYWQQYAATSVSPLTGHSFWNDYRHIYLSGLTEREQSKIHDFDYVFFEKKPEGYAAEQLDLLRSNFSPAALRAALFIMLYRDFPVFQTSYQVLDALIEIDHLMSNWRHKHLIMVRRMIGMRVGTGNTSGAGYLEGALSKHYVYKDLSGLSTYLIERRKLPALPAALIANLGFHV
ncbi:tryptophan 2,3-dioxygenase family protein [Sediminibacterium soli]|uniref:tryptophan 2,3-dioxygenase family protein n=1 Tax=Sediminibacterium soli TaxID=2698829 RepID=UPI00137A1D3D|nr:tryptophan 2,3-dioxygenase family protein [Sediminibacterium soli]NCI46048.1 tryptophan 2,3-dioxygenase [Sediminibacterium soli]